MLFRRTKLKKEIFKQVEELKNFPITEELLEDLTNKELVELNKYLNLSIHYQVKASNVFCKKCGIDFSEILDSIYIDIIK